MRVSKIADPEPKSRSSNHCACCSAHITSTLPLESLVFWPAQCFTLIFLCIQIHLPPPSLAPLPFETPSTLTLGPPHPLTASHVASMLYLLQAHLQSCLFTKVSLQSLQAPVAYIYSCTLPWFWTRHVQSQVHISSKCSFKLLSFGIKIPPVLKVFFLAINLEVCMSLII